MLAGTFRPPHALCRQQTRGGSWKATPLSPEGGPFPLTGSFREVEEGSTMILAGLAAHVEA
ncbi:hypothetical protein [Streptomyces silaceus]|uniref:hypothetical protein n=1 Tax=Streptomyces silaceus TaxID=545123 RepID=UPI0006EBA469|nr:hypothetical protein [Streptomyces silaceus]